MSGLDVLEGHGTVVSGCLNLLLEQFYLGFGIVCHFHLLQSFKTVLNEGAFPLRPFKTAPHTGDEEVALTPENTRNAGRGKSREKECLGKASVDITNENKGSPSLFSPFLQATAAFDVWKQSHGAYRPAKQNRGSPSKIKSVRVYLSSHELDVF